MTVTTDLAETDFLVGYFENVVVDNELVFAHRRQSAYTLALSAPCGCTAHYTRRSGSFAACADHHERLTTALTPEGAVP